MMTVTQQSAIEQIDLVLNRLKEVQNLPPHTADRWDAIYEIISSMLSAFDRLTMPGSLYRQRVEEVTKDLRNNQDVLMGRLGGVLRALRNDYAGGYMQSIQEFIHADVFTDFIEMSEYLLEQGYKDASAVMVGSVLEEHLRKLANKNGIDTSFLTPQGDTRPKKLDTINAELAKNNVYNKSDQKDITAWAEIRNNAAHGKYTEYTKEKVELMTRGVRNLISRFPA